MNWLAHLVLSEPSPAFRIGNLLPDLMTRAELETVSSIFYLGIECHRRIDAFTDAHPVVRRSVRRLSAPHRRFGPVLVDIFYDHFLSVQWACHWPQSQVEFAKEIYCSFDAYRAQLPAATFGVLQRMRGENWLASYGEIAGVQLTLERMARRLSRPVQLGAAVIELERNYDGLRADFEEFFPQLRSHVEARYSSRDSSSSTRACLSPPG